MKQSDLVDSEQNWRQALSTDPIYFPEDEIIIARAENLLKEAEQNWLNRDGFRQRRRRVMNFIAGNQWSDVILNPDYDEDDASSDEPETISEKDYLSKHGRLPAVANLMAKLMRNLMGQYREGRPDHMCIARQRDRASDAELMTAAMRYALDLNECTELDAHQLREFLMSGCAGWRTKFEWWHDENREDVRVDPIDQDRFFHSTAKDPRLTDINMVGYLHDLTIEEAIHYFGKTQVMQDKLAKVLGFSDDARTQQFDWINSQDGEGEFVDDFRTPRDYTKMRVIEIWKREYARRIMAYDPMDGTTRLLSSRQDKWLSETMKERQIQAEILGLALEELAPVIDERFESLWTCYYMTPEGKVLFYMPTPYWHGQTPYDFVMYPMIDGRVHGMFYELLDQQKYVNRMISIIDFILASGAKGMTFMPEDMVPTGMSPKEFTKSYRSINGITFYKASTQHQHKPTTVMNSGLPAGTMELLNVNMQLIEDISGVNGPIQGKNPKSAQAPASLYAQQTLNAGLNVKDPFDVFQSGLRRRNSKIVKTIQQFYQEPRYIRVQSFAGQYADTEYSPEKVSELDFDTVIGTGSNSAVFRQMIDGTLRELVSANLITFEDYLESSSMPFADQLLAKVRSRREALESQGIIASPATAGV